MARVLEQQAIEDALGGAIEITEMLMRPCRLVELIDTAGRVEAGGGSE